MSKPTGRAVFVVLFAGLSAYASVRQVGRSWNPDPTDHLFFIVSIWFALLGFLCGGTALLIAVRSKPELPQFFTMAPVVLTLAALLLLGLRMG